jgi:hypothetical protein
MLSISVDRLALECLMILKSPFADLDIPDTPLTPFVLWQAEQLAR